MAEKPKATSSQAEKELDRVEQQFKDFDANVKTLTQDAMNHSPVLETEPQVKRAQVDLAKMDYLVIKPHKTIGSKEPFNEKWRESYNFYKERVNIEAENLEVIGEVLDFWTKPYPGMPAEEWKVPVNTPVNVPRYVAERIDNCIYHELHMEQSTQTASGSEGTYFGGLAVKKTKHRLQAKPVMKKTSLFMSTFS